jgi:hypothetical protein
MLKESRPGCGGIGFPGGITIISPANTFDIDKIENTINKERLIKFEVFILE